jgi:hypothetical protein
VKKLEAPFMLAASFQRLSVRLVVKGYILFVKQIKGENSEQYLKMQRSFDTIPTYCLVGGHINDSMGFS